jgi:hypothetical protein
MRIELILLVFDGRPDFAKIDPLAVRLSFTLEKKDYPSFAPKELMGFIGETLHYVNPCPVPREIKIGRQISQYVSTALCYDCWNR